MDVYILAELCWESGVEIRGVFASRRYAEEALERVSEHEFIERQDLVIEQHELLTQDNPLEASL